MKDETITTITGPWWLLQLWLNLNMQKIMTQDLRSLKFPSLTFLEEQEEQLTDDNRTRRCMSFGEVASAIFINGSISYFFKLLYKGFSGEILEWFIYSDIPEFDLPYSFRFESKYTDAGPLKILNCLIKPCLLSIEVRHGREKLPISYEFYNPSIAARQLGFGQLPPKLFFADKLKPREAISSGIEFSRIL
jgi:hypothetical protein